MQFIAIVHSYPFFRWQNTSVVVHYLCRCGRFPPEVRTAIPVEGRFEHIVLSCNAIFDHGIIWTEREAQKALEVSIPKTLPFSVQITPTSSPRTGACTYAHKYIWCRKFITRSSIREVLLLMLLRDAYLFLGCMFSKYHHPKVTVEFFFFFLLHSILFRNCSLSDCSVWTSFSMNENYWTTISVIRELKLFCFWEREY